jgi:hypothetical protein
MVANGRAWGSEDIVGGPLWVGTGIRPPTFGFHHLIHNVAKVLSGFIPEGAAHLLSPPR